MLNRAKTTRRSLLAGLAAASAAAATVSEAQTAALENSVLLRLGDATPTLQDAYTAAQADVERIAAEYRPQWPTPDPDIIHFGSGSRRHADILGRGVPMALGKSTFSRVHDLGTPEAFEASYKGHMKKAARLSKTKSKRGMKQQLAWAERDKARIAPARAYWAEVDRITALSGIEAATQHRDATRDVLNAHVNAIMETEAKTMEGLVVKAQALAAWGNVDPFWRNLNLDAPKWSDDIAASIMRLSGEQLG